MPFVTNDDHRIHYEVARAASGDGPALLLQHRMAQSTKCWYPDGYVDALSANHRLVMVDARGHGQGDKPHEPAQRAAAAMPQATFASLLQLQHSAAFRATGAVLVPVQAFLSRLASAASAP